MIVPMSDAVYVLAPAAVPQVDFRINNAGSGDVLTWLSNTIPQPTPEQLTAVTQEQVTAARMVAIRSAAIQAAIGSANTSDTATRAAVGELWTGMNDHAEILGYIVTDLMQVTRAKFVADITKKRSDWIAAGNKFEQEPTEPGLMFDELTRLAQSMIVRYLGEAIAGGAGDPIKV